MYILKYRAVSIKSVLLLPFVTTDKRKCHSGMSVTTVEVSLKHQGEKDKTCYPASAKKCIIPAAYAKTIDIKQ
jgi:hypothetical protein